MEYHETLTAGGLFYWFGWALAAFVVAFPIWLGRTLSPVARVRFEKIWGAALLVSYAISTGASVLNHTFSWQESLLFHLCGWSRMMTVFYLWTKNYSVGELVTFTGIAGGLQSLLTPELTHGLTPINFIDYYFNHASIIAIGFYIILVHKHRLKPRAWLRSFGRTQILLAITIVINLLLGANYMYAMEPPIADNPLIIRSETIPYLHLVFFELFAALHFAVLQFALVRIKVRHPKI